MGLDLGLIEKAPSGSWTAGDRESRPKEVIYTMDIKRKLIFLAVPAVLAVGGAGMVVAHAATPTPSPGTAQAAEPAESATEPTGAAEATEAPEAPGAPQVGHADPNGTADHQFEGQE